MKIDAKINPEGILRATSAPRSNLHESGIPKSSKIHQNLTPESNKIGPKSYPEGALKATSYPNSFLHRFWLRFQPTFGTKILQRSIQNEDLYSAWFSIDFWSENWRFR